MSRAHAAVMDLLASVRTLYARALWSPHPITIWDFDNEIGPSLRAMHRECGCGEMGDARADAGLARVVGWSGSDGDRLYRVAEALEHATRLDGYAVPRSRALVAAEHALGRLRDRLVRADAALAPALLDTGELLTQSRAGRSR